MRRHAHHAVHLVVFAPVDADQANRRIAGIAIRMRHPRLGGERGDLGAQPLGVEANRQPIEALRKPHAGSG